MSNKITIIGAGQVGSTVAYALTLKQLASEIVIIDIIKEKAMGEAMDIRQGTPFIGPVYIHDGDYEDAKDSDIVIFTSGVGRKPGQSRLDLTQTNVNIAKSVIPLITKAAPNALYLIVANPVDILTYLFVKTSGIPASHIFGTGTMLDTARFRARIAETYRVGATNVHGYVFGEHGDSSFVPWSLANIGSIPVDSFASSFTGKKLPDFNKDDIEDYIRKSGGIIINAKKFTNYGIGATTADLVDALKYSTDSVLTISSMMNGEYGINDVCISIPTLIGQNGIKGHLAAPLTDDEVTKLRHSADCLKDIIKQIEF
ncbi:L-lactate dehydrogenase [Treponema sp. Marseille-Q3903]|jgi:L-lactate dehydrogenase|uniref:L-lactate dehydrogenase n=1 Tax=Treponema sp. Marseille-Q3903 TaxID=2766703 RepID=UPI001652161E|nr:L-lactate dehydrogenase [Treponema sp. Marseille-Q3903]MBC6713629.1 L-lactate dehydrogenase [Treponema sp. Marseille-Q3903]